MIEGRRFLARRLRARGALAGLAVILGLLALAFFRVQILSSDRYRLRAESNRLRPLQVPAPRGTIFDRNGRVIADNVPGYAVSILPSSEEIVEETLHRMAGFLNLSPSRIDQVLRARNLAPRQPVLVTLDAGFEPVSRLQERRSEFTNVWVEMRPRRRYPSGPAAAHLVGYIGQITPGQLDAPEFDPDRYEQGMIVGQAGIERQYEALLQGERGVRLVEVDAGGGIVGDFAGIPNTPVVPGRDLTLNLDLDLQEWIHEIFPDTLMGAVVALDPADGGVLALYSAPSYDPNLFVGGIETEAWDGLLNDPRTPLLNRPVQGIYPPASTWKLATAAIALDLGIVTPGERMPEPCTGGYMFGRYWRCWKPEGHGDVDLIEAIQHSCDVYFYQLGRRIGLDRLLRRSTEIGFGQRCGIDLPLESRGNFPADRQYWMDTYGQPATEGETLSLSIGQGPNDQTPLKIAQFYLAIARNGSAPPPTVLRNAELRTPGAEEWTLDLSQEALDALREGIRRVTAFGGTAYCASLEHWDLLGKTGTAQNPLSLRGLAEDHAWFAGMAGPRGGAPEIVVVALVEFGESGSAMAAPIVAKTADFYLRRKYEMPIDSVQTVREYTSRFGPPDWAPAGCY